MEGKVICLHSRDLNTLASNPRGWTFARDLIKSDQVPLPQLWELFNDYPKFAAWYADEEQRWRALAEDQLAAQDRLDGYRSPSNVVPFRRPA